MHQINNASAPAIKRKEFHENVFVIALVSWWLIFVPTRIIYITKRLLQKLYDFFTISLLFRTLLLPWKRDELDSTNASLDVKIRIWMMNLVSIFVGFTVRSMTIVVGFVSLGAVLVLSLLVLIIFYLLPFLSIAMFIMAIRSSYGLF